QAHGAELVDRGDQRGGATDAGDLLDHDAGGDRVGALAAVGLGDVHGVEARGVERAQRLLGEAGLTVDGLGVRGDLLLRQGADGSTQLVVEVLELEQVEIGVSRHWARSWVSGLSHRHSVPYYRASPA